MGGGKDLKNRCKTHGCLYKFLNITTNFVKKIIEELKRKLSGRNTLIPPARASCRGLILIEFTVCMPVLIILLFYINDLVKIKRWYSQTEFVAQQAANMIQNISQRRAGEATTEEQRKNLLKISKRDLQHIFTLATLTIYPDNNFCSIYKGHKHGHFGEIFLYYVQGNANGTADVLWGYDIQMYINSLNPSAISVNPREALNGRSHVKILTGVPPQDIWPTLKIGPTDKKRFKSRLERIFS